MMTAFRLLSALLVCCLFGSVARAEEATTGTRLERRLLLKQSHFFFSGGPCYFARGDYFNTPGLSARVSYYPIESGGLDVQVAGFYSFLSTAADEMLTRFGALPDAQKPRALAMVGWRQSVGYGKMLVANSLNTTVHFDLQLTAHVGTVVTDQAVNPAGMLGAGLVARVSPTLYGQFDLPFVISHESRQNGSVAVGVLPMLSVGGTL